MVPMMTLDVTAELSPIFWGTAVVAIVCGLGILFESVRDNRFRAWFETRLRTPQRQAPRQLFITPGGIDSRHLAIRTPSSAAPARS